MSEPAPQSVRTSDRVLRRVTSFSAKRPALVLLIATLIGILSFWYASQLKIEGSFVALLPNESPTGQRFKETVSRRAGGSSTLIVMVSSEVEEKNRQFVDDLAKELESLPAGTIEAVETGPGEAREFFLKWRWLFASRRDLALFRCKIEREKEKRKPGYLDLDDPCEESVEYEEGSDEDLLALSAPKKKSEESDEPVLPRPDESELEKYRRKLDERLKKLDRYPTGYFQKDNGQIFSIMIRTSSTGMGEFGTDDLMNQVKSSVKKLDPQARGIEVGYAGDIPNAIEQRDALVNDMAVISFVAIALILGSIVLFFRSFLSLLQIGFCVTIGCGLAFAVAMAAYGRLNTATSFLGAIIAGNGINYGIIYLSRYRELRAEGQVREDALIEAALSSRKGTWLAAVAAGGAYAALLLTSFRGFSEFGLIGGVGMVFCWISTFLILPAQISLTEKLLPKQAARTKGTVKLPLGFIGRIASHRSIAVLVIAALATGVAVVPLGSYLKDPWEYNFSRLGSSKSKKKGAGNWSKKANKVFRSRGSPMLVLADDMKEVQGLKARLLEEDQRVTEGKYLERVETIYDRLGGPPEIVEEKLSILEDIRNEIDSALPRLREKDKAIARDFRPPSYLRALEPEDLPPLVKAQFTEKNGTVGTQLYVYLSRGLSQSNGHNLLRISEIFESVELPSGRIAPNASRSTVFAAMIRAMETDGPRATLVAFLTVIFVTLIVTRRLFIAAAIVGSLLCGILLTVGGAAWLDVRLNFLNFVALPLTFGIGVEYAINLFERIRRSPTILDGVRSIGGPVSLCSLTTILGYGALTMADNMALQSFGRYAIAGELACILTALFVLPAALSLRARKQSPHDRSSRLSF